MKQHFTTIIVAVVAVALSLAFFFTGFFVRGWVDRELAATGPTATDQLPTQVANVPAAIPTQVTSPLTDISPDDDPASGPADARVTIIEFSDYQCPFCTRGYNTIETQVLKEYGDKVKFYYMNFPLPMHPWAQPAAVAAECALLQNKDAYWTLYNYYFTNQKEITPQNLKEKTLEALKDSKIDTAKFNECFDNNKTADEVKRQMAEGQSVGVTGTPAFIINGRLVSGAQPFENFKAVIDDELNRKS